MITLYPTLPTSTVLQLKIDWDNANKTPNITHISFSGLYKGYLLLHSNAISLNLTHHWKPYEKHIEPSTFYVLVVFFFMTVSKSILIGWIK